MAAISNSDGRLILIFRPLSATVKNVAGVAEEVKMNGIYTGLFLITLSTSSSTLTLARD